MWSSMADFFSTPIEASGNQIFIMITSDGHLSGKNFSASIKFGIRAKLYIYYVFLSIAPFLDLIVWQEIPQFPCHTFEQKNSVLLSTHQTFHTVVLLHVTYFEAPKPNNCSISLVFLQETLSFTVAQIPSMQHQTSLGPFFFNRFFCCMD